MPPYKTTPVFDQNTLPAGLQNEHRTKEGTWGIIRMLEGELRYIVIETGVETILTPEQPGLILPEQLHRVQLLGAMRMQVEFYDQNPAL